MLFLILPIVAIFLLCYISIAKPKNFPTGPFWYPVVGSALAVREARKKTGMLITAVKNIANEFPQEQGVIGFKIGKDKVVFAYTMESLLEFYSNLDLDGRPFGPFYETRTWNLRRGILLTDEDFWVVQRRFVQRHLKEFGYARKGMREICENEAEFCLKDFYKLINANGGKCVTVKMPNHFSLHVLNTIWVMMAGIRYESDNEDLRYLQGLLNDLFENIDMMGAQFSHFPFLRYIAPQASGYSSFVACHNNIHEFVKNEVEKHRIVFDPSNEPRDLIDAYLKVIEGDANNNESQKPDESFSELQLLAVCLDIFMAGTETTNKSTNFMFLHLIRNPSIQRKAREEIDRVVGRSRLPKLDDKVNMPYCDAIVHETVRSFMKYTFGIAHRALKDTKLRGFDIPKDTMVVAMFSGLMNDSRIIKNPTEFDPQNFLDENGKLSIPENFYPFGLGKHRCLGETLAKTNLFMLCTTMLQNFYFDIPLGHDRPSDEPIDGATPSVQDYEALVSLRE